MKGADIKRRLAETGRRQADLARFMSEDLGRAISQKTVSRMVLDPKRKLGTEEAAAIERFFSSDDFRIPPGASASIGGYAPHRARVPLYGLAAAAGGDRIAIAQDRILDMIDAPFSNIDAAFRVMGESMEPRLFAGETVFVRFGLQPAKGGDAVIELKDDAHNQSGEGGVIIKTFMGVKDGWLFLKQWNPDSEIRFRWDQVRALHAVRARA